MTVDVVILAFRSGETIDRCLEHLARQTREHRVIVVDNGSGDGTPERLREAWPQATVVGLGENVGFSRGVNRGVRLGDGEAIVCLNDDVEAEPDFLERLVAPLEADPGVGAVAAMLLMPDGAGVDGFGVEADATLMGYNRLRGRDPSAPAGVLAAPSGGAAAYRRAAFEAAGGFDEALFSYSEDLDLGLRLRLAGWRMAEAPDARGIHLGGASWGRVPAARRARGAFGRGFLLRRYGVLRGRSAPRALAFEAMAAGHGSLQDRSLEPLRARVAGWRAAAGSRRPLPPGAVDRSIGWREALRRQRGG